MLLLRSSPESLDETERGRLTPALCQRNEAAKQRDNHLERLHRLQAEQDAVLNAGQQQQRPSNRRKQAPATSAQEQSRRRVRYADQAAGHLPAQAAPTSQRERRGRHMEVC